MKKSPFKFRFILICHSNQWKNETALKTLCGSFCTSFSSSYYSFTADKNPNKIALNVPKNMLGISPFCYFVSFSVVSLTPFINKPDSAKKQQPIFMISLSFSIWRYCCNVVYIRDPKSFIWVAVLLTVQLLILMISKYF